jgi:3-deoxy-manno-octulosonate cytidylyltransferase (CMP-KDO synthetase)
MLDWVYRSAQRADRIDEVVVATPDQEIMDFCKLSDYACVMTSPVHERASERVAEVAMADAIPADIYVLFQGDEPLVQPAHINTAVDSLVASTGVACVNLVSEIKETFEATDTNCVKVVSDLNQDALYFSRSSIPDSTHGKTSPAYKQVCVIPFWYDTLIEFNNLEPTQLELAESIDMLRFVENGKKVRTVAIDSYIHPVDVPEDVAIVERHLGPLND